MRCRTRRRRRRSGSCTWDRQLPSRPPGLVHRPRRDAADWGIAAFTGRRPGRRRGAGPQDGLYTLITQGRRRRHLRADRLAIRGARGRRPRRVPGLPEPARGRSCHDHGDRGRVRPRSRTGGCDAPPRSTPTSGPARRSRVLRCRLCRPSWSPVCWPGAAADAGPITILSCDNLPDNGTVTGTVVTESRRRGRRALTEWIDEQRRLRLVDGGPDHPGHHRRRPGAGGRTLRLPATPHRCHRAVQRVGDLADRSRPADRAGRTPGRSSSPTSPRSSSASCGCSTARTPCWRTPAASVATPSIDEAIADPACRGWVEAFWDEAAPHLRLPADEIRDYRAALLERYANPRIRHRLAQIAADGSTKIAVRILPTLRAERAAGRVPLGCATVLAAWVLHLRGHGAPVADPGADPYLTALATDDETAVARCWTCSTLMPRTPGAWQRRPHGGGSGGAARRRGRGAEETEMSEAYGTDPGDPSSTTDRWDRASTSPDQVTAFVGRPRCRGPGRQAGLPGRAGPHPDLPAAR